MRLVLGEHVIDCTTRTAIMGILNLSPDSPVAHSIAPTREAVQRAVKLHEAGADIIDVGGRSTHTGSQIMSVDQEIELVCPVIEAIRGEGIPVSVDTSTPSVARAAAAAGVHLLNDVSGARDSEMVQVAADYRLPCVVMHMRGEPTRHREVDQHYDDIASEVHSFLLDRAAALERAGAGTPWLDPGFEFGKSLADNLAMLGALPHLVATGYPVLISASRKGFLAEVLGYVKRQDVDGLLEATIAFNSIASYLGVHVVRVHDVRQVAYALAVTQALARWNNSPHPKGSFEAGR